MDTQTTFSKALRALQSRDFAVAHRLLRDVIEKQPRHVAALNLLAVALMSTDRYAEAERYVSRALRLDQSSDVSFYNYGLILKKLNRPEEALAQFDRALKLNRNVCETWNNRGSALNDLGRHEEALSAFDTAISLNSRYVEALYNRAKTFALLKLHPDALAGFHAALGLRPGFAEAWLGCGDSHFALAQYGESLSSFQRAASLQPASAEPWFGSANALVRLYRPEEAVTAYDRAISLKPEFAVAWMNRAYALLDLNRHDDAKRAFDKAVAIDPTLTEARFSSCVAALPVVYSSADEIPMSRSAYENALTAFSVSAHAVEKGVAQKIWGRLPFLLAYQGYNDRDLQTLYGSMASRIMADAFPAPSLARSPQFDRPVRVGVVSAHFHSHSNWKIPIKGWIGQLDRARFQIFGYHVGERRDAETDVAKRMCHQFVEGARTVESWRQQIIVDEVDVLIYPGAVHGSHLDATRRTTTGPGAVQFLGPSGYERHADARFFSE